MFQKITKERTQKKIAKVGAAYCVLDELAEHQLLPTIEELMKSKEKRAALCEAMHVFSPKKNSSATIASQLLALTEQNPEVYAVQEA